MSRLVLALFRPVTVLNSEVKLIAIANCRRVSIVTLLFVDIRVTLFSSSWAERPLGIAILRSKLVGRAEVSLKDDSVIILEARGLSSCIARVIVLFVDGFAIRLVSFKGVFLRFISVDRSRAR